jgi:hypothetical protein
MGDQQIRRSARRLRIGVIAMLGFVLFLVVCGHFGVRVAGAPVLLQSRSGAASNFIIANGVLLLVTIAIFWLTEALRLVAAGSLFSRAVVRRFRLFALWMLIMALFSTIAPMALSAAVSPSIGRHRIMLVVDVPDLLLIGLTLLLLLIARMFERARAIEDEMSEIV